ncbi:amino acid permease [Ancylomarina sp. DW003]|nr:amino acid permease [Ancylomarina sp. DW003]MDE5420872.1 amino acid permease [Ancylomarina sp. DW003]
MPEDLQSRKFGTAPVFFTAISTILGAVLFLRFGFAVGTVGFWGVILIIVLGHLVTIPTAFAISELATNKRVEGGGEYFIISRSFGLNIGATIGLALFFSQAISVAFYVIAFTEAFEPVFNWIQTNYNMSLPRQLISVPAMLLLSVLILKKGANLGVKALYFVVAILFASLLLFFLGDTPHAAVSDFSVFKGEFRNSDNFFVIFAIIFPAFTGMTAGVGLSGDLKNPSKSIPWGTTAATFIGMVIYVLVVYKLAQFASAEDLLEHQLIMSKIALGGAIVIPLGLAASTISSALGSVMVAPRTLQALSVDRSLPSRGLNSWLAKGRQKDGEPINASLVTCLIALFFVILGDINAVAEVISMFFMVTYGALCLISFLNHFGSSPSYRPSFKSKWYLSMLGFVVSILIMFKINTLYALAAILLMVITYLYINSYHKDRHGLASIFLNSLYQLNRNVQVFLQKAGKKRVQEWRPSAICISKDSFERDTAFKLLNWIAYKYGFGTYLHRIEGYYSKASHMQAKEELDLLVSRSENVGNHVFVDTIISPSYTSAIAQAIQLPGVAGMENNMVIFEYDKSSAENLEEIIENYALANAGNFDFCVLGSSNRTFKLKSDIHIWIKPSDADNANLMILLSFIIAGHPDWKKADIKIFNICKEQQATEVRQSLDEMIASGRLPIRNSNVEVLIEQENVSPKEMINERSEHAGLTLIGFRGDLIKHEGAEMFKGYDNLGHILFVNANSKKEIE